MRILKFSLLPAMMCLFTFMSVAHSMDTDTVCDNARYACRNTPGAKKSTSDGYFLYNICTRDSTGATVWVYADCLEHEVNNLNSNTIVIDGQSVRYQFNTRSNASQGISCKGSDCHNNKCDWNCGSSKFSW